MREAGRRRVAMLVVALLGAVTFTGCMSAESEGVTPSEGGPNAGGDAVDAASGPASEGDAGGSDEIVATVQPAAPVERTLYLTASGDLVDAVPEPGAMTMAGSHVGCLVLMACTVANFEGPRLTDAVVIEPGVVTVSLWLEATAPVVAPGFIDVAAWFGSTKATFVMALAPVGRPVLLPGEPVRVDLELDFSDAAAQVVPAGEALRLISLSGTVHEESGILQLRTGGDTASSVTFKTRPLPASEVAATAGVQEDTLTGMIPLSGWPAGGVVGGEERSWVAHTVALDANASFAEFVLDAAGGLRPGDIDLDVYAGDRLLAGSHTPFAHEVVYLAGPALEGLAGTELRVVVSQFNGAGTEYAVQVRQG